MNGIRGRTFRDMCEVGCRRPERVESAHPLPDLQRGHMLRGIVSDGIPPPIKQNNPDHYIGPENAVAGTFRIIR